MPVPDSPEWDVPTTASAAGPGARGQAKFRPDRKLGAGGMGEVFRAWDSTLARWVALKYLRGGDDEEIARFKREAQLAAKLSHPHIAAVFEVGEEGGRHYIAMQYVDGGTLKGWKGDRRVLIAVMRDAARAVGCAHRQGVIHRDLKPENLLISGDPPHVYVTDFGLARAVEGRSELSISGHVVGTPSYMSPEQARGGRADERSDVYGLGATLYELLAGRPPLVGSSVLNTLMMVLETEPPLPSASDASIDRDIETIVLKCLEKDPARRYATADELADDLERFLAGEPVLARPASVFYRLRKRLARRRAVVAASLLGAAAVAAVLAITVPKWLGAVRARDEQKRAADEQREREAAAALRRERARGPIEQGRRLIDQMRATMRDKDYKHSEIVFLAEKARQEFVHALEACPDHPEAHLGIGVALALSGSAARAMESFERAIAAAPEFTTPYVERVRILVARYDGLRHRYRGEVADETREAEALRLRIEEDLARVEKVSPHSYERIYAQAILAFARGEYAPAADALKKYLAIAPADPSSHYWRGHAFYHLDRISDAEHEFTEAISLDRRYVDALNGRALCRFKRGGHKQAVSDYGRAIEGRPEDGTLYTNRAGPRFQLGDFKGAVEDAAQALSLLPRQWQAHLVRAMALLRLGDPDAALADCDRAVEINPDVPDAHFIRGNALKARKDLQGAVASYVRAIELEPGNSMYWFNRGNTRRLLGDADGAIADFTEALSLDKQYVEALNNRALARRAKGDLQGALRDLDAALKLDPKHEFAWGNRASVRRTLGDFDGALADCEELLKLAPSSPEAHYTRAHVRQQRGDLQAALADFARAIELNPRYDEAFNDRGVLKHRLKDYDGALADFDAAIAIDPRNPEPWTNRGVQLARRGDHAGAVRAQTRAIELRPASAAFHRRRAEAREKSDDRGGAIADAKKALTLAIDDRDRAACEALLRRLE